MARGREAEKALKCGAGLCELHVLLALGEPRTGFLRGFLDQDDQESGRTVAQQRLGWGGVKGGGDIS